MTDFKSKNGFDFKGIQYNGSNEDEIVELGGEIQKVGEVLKIWDRVNKVWTTCKVNYWACELTVKGGNEKFFQPLSPTMFEYVVKNEV